MSIEPFTKYDRQDRKAFFETEILREAQRFLSFMDRCPVSKSRGCCDREFWAWATKDFVNMDLQRMVLVISYLYSNDFPNNDFYHQPAMLEWIQNGIEFWVVSQYPSGTFDHLYIYENDWMAAAFTLTDMVGSYNLVGNDIDRQLKDRWLAAMQRAGMFLVRNDEVHGYISNHRAGAAAGLLGLFNITNKEAFRNRAWELMKNVYETQSAEGWFCEYNGADPGYQTLDTHYQSLFYLHSNKEARVLEQVKKSLEFLIYFVHPDGSIGGEYGSRKCPHFFPGGFEVFAGMIGEAEAIASHGCKGLATGASCGLAGAEGRNAVPLATSYVTALIALNKYKETQPDPPQTPVAAEMPFERTFERAWPAAGLFVRSDSNKYIVFGASNAGVIKVFDKHTRELQYSSCGYAGKLSNGASITSLFHNSNPDFSFGDTTSDGEMPVANMREVKVNSSFFFFQTDRVMSPLKFYLFRTFNISLGRINSLNLIVRRFITATFIKKRKLVPVKIERTFTTTDDDYTITDEINITGNANIAELREHGFFSTVYMASARYFRKQDLTHAWSSEDLSGSFKSGKLVREKKLDQ